MTQQERTVRLTAQPSEDDDVFSRGEAWIIGPGINGRVQAGQTLRQAFAAAEIPMPTERQTVRVNLDEVADMDRVLRRGDRVTVTNRVMGAVDC